MGIFRRLLEQNAESPAVHLLLGQAYAQQNDCVNALAEFDCAVQLDPRLVEAHYYSGLVYLRQGDCESAATQFHSELGLRPEDPITSYHLGYALALQGQAAAAITILERVVKAKTRLRKQPSLSSAARCYRSAMLWVPSSTSKRQRKSYLTATPHTFS